MEGGDGSRRVDRRYIVGAKRQRCRTELTATGFGRGAVSSALGGSGQMLVSVVGPRGRRCTQGEARLGLEPGCAVLRFDSMRGIIRGGLSRLDPGRR